MSINWDLISKKRLTAWEVSGRDYGRIPAIHAAELVRRIQNSQDFTLLDVRKKEMNTPYGSRTRISTCISTELTDPHMFFAYCKTE